MGDTTGISWTDSTMNFWEGCTKVGPGCDHCYAEARDQRWHGGEHWGAGAPRRRMVDATRKRPLIWNQNADTFRRVHGHPQRVFCSSLADVFDNEVPDEWRAEAFDVMEATPDLRWQLCTKRVSNIAKMVPRDWLGFGSEPLNVWPDNVGVLITVVTPEEVARDVPRLVELKMRFGIPWVGLSIEPMIADVAGALADLGAMLGRVDWVILGGESGPHARPCYLSWIMRAKIAAKARGCAVFIKQLGADARYASETPVPLRDPAGKDPTEWPRLTSTPGNWDSPLHAFEFPAALC